MKTPSLTNLDTSPEDDRRARMRRYSIAMGIRVACLLCMIFARGWWLIFFAVGAIALPYFAVIMANVSSKRAQSSQRPDKVLRRLDDTSTDYYPREYGGRPE